MRRCNVSLVALGLCAIISICVPERSFAACVATPAKQEAAVDKAKEKATKEAEDAAGDAVKDATEALKKKAKNKLKELNPFSSIQNLLPGTTAIAKGIRWLVTPQDAFAYVAADPTANISVVEAIEEEVLGVRCRSTDNSCNISLSSGVSKRVGFSATPDGTGNYHVRLTNAVSLYVFLSAAAYGYTEASDTAAIQAALDAYQASHGPGSLDLELNGIGQAVVDSLHSIIP